MTTIDLEFAALMDRAGLMVPRFLRNIATRYDYRPGMYVVNETLEGLCALDVTLIVRVTVGDVSAEGPLEDFGISPASIPRRSTKS